MKSRLLLNQPLVSSSYTEILQTLITLTTDIKKNPLIQTGMKKKTHRDMNQIDDMNKTPFYRFWRTNCLTMLHILYSIDLKVTGRQLMQTEYYILAYKHHKFYESSNYRLTHF